MYFVDTDGIKEVKEEEDTGLDMLLERVYNAVLGSLDDLLSHILKQLFDDFTDSRRYDTHPDLWSRKANSFIIQILIPLVKTFVGSLL